MSTIIVVDVITQYLMTFGPLLGDIKKKFYPSNFRTTVNNCDRHLSEVVADNKFRFMTSHSMTNRDDRIRTSDLVFPKPWALFEESLETLVAI